MATAGIHAEEVVPNGNRVPGAIREDELQPTYVWDFVVRATHWTIFLSMILLSVTGVYIGRPWGAASTGPAGQHFAMGWARVLHAYGAIAFTLAVLSRITWMFIGPRRIGWRQFIPTTKRRLRDMKSTFLFYTFFRDRPPATIGHNPLAGLTYVAVFGLYLLMITTGLALYSMSSHSYMQFWQFLVPVFHGAQTARWLHHVSMWLLIGFVVHHVYSAILTSRVEKNGALDSIFSGYKFLPKDMPDDDE
ncbi:MAG TPA: Ni/Fe-hydrogenase, b-type cytochrome subunit [Kofleriaceae bacterium]